VTSSHHPLASERHSSSDASTAPICSLFVVEPVFTCHELAEAWKLSVDTIRNMFLEEPDVVIIATPRKRGTRIYRTLRIPESVVRRVWTRLQTKSKRPS